MLALLTVLPFIANAEQDNNVVSGEFLIRFSLNATAADKDRVLKRVNGQEVEKIRDKNKKK